MNRIGLVRPIGMFRFQSCIAALFIVVAVTTFSSSKKPAAPKRKSPVALTQEQRAIHALNRLTFGPRPGDLDNVLRVGVDRWIDQQTEKKAGGRTR